MIKNNPGKEIIRYIFSCFKDAEIIEELKRVLDRTDEGFKLDAAEELLVLMETHLEEKQDVYNYLLDFLSGSTRPMAKYVYARIAASKGDYDTAIENITTALGSLAKSDPFILLNRAKFFLRANQMAEAADDLQSALSLYPPYHFYVMCERFLGKIIASGEWVPRRRIKVALLGSSTTAFLEPVIKAVCFKDGISVEIYQGLYGNYQQEILNPGSGLYAFAPDVAVIMPNQRDLALPPGGKENYAGRIISEIRNLWSELKRQNPCHIIQVGFDLPPDGAWGSLEDTLAGGRRRTVYEINSAISGDLPAGVSYLDINKISSMFGNRFFSEEEWYTARQYPSTAALPTLAEQICAHIRAIYGLSAKVLVVDLDNTLWGGVIGEDGLSGIVLGPPAPEGEAFLDLQRYARELKERGILLAVCSKNNLEDAELPFKKHDAMVLKLDDMTVFTANWQDKATNIAEMSKNLSLGLDSFVFLDDNPLERAWVRSQLRQVIVPECGSKPWEMLSALKRGMYFESVALTAEDTQRHLSYRANLERRELENKAGTLEDFLSGLEMVAESGPVDALTLTRVTQLINKTNQFNLTTRRYTEEQIKTMSQSPEWWTRWYRLKDKYGDHGLIGVILAKKSGDSWHVDDWLMSCRVLGRNMEDYMCAELLSAAAEGGAAKVIGEYIPTAKNELVKDMYTRLGFNRNRNKNSFHYLLEANAIPICKFIMRRS
jgi:FkbH-like protein